MPKITRAFPQPSLNYADRSPGKSALGESVNDSTSVGKQFLDDDSAGWDFGDDLESWDLGDESAPLNESQSQTHRFANDTINELFQEKLAAGEPDRDPVKFLSFVAQNTNPQWASFAWENFVEAIKACFKERSHLPLWNLGLSLNCVRCAQAVDLTLQHVFSGTNNNAEQKNLIQVASGRPAAFTSYFENIQAFSSRDGDARYLETLKDTVKPGQRACINVPVTGVKGRFSHAMNLINLGPSQPGSQDRVFIICGQSGRVFNLQNDSDIEAFYARHTNDSPDHYENDVKYALSSDVREEQESIFQDLSAGKIGKSDSDPSFISYA